MISIALVWACARKAVYTYHAKQPDSKAFPLLRWGTANWWNLLYRSSASVGTRGSTENTYACVARLKYRRNKYNHLKNEFQGFLKKGGQDLTYTFRFSLKTHGHICSTSLCEVTTMSHNWRVNEDTVHQGFDNNMRRYCTRTHEDDNELHGRVMGS
jgi:hypothetical protein